MQARVLGNNVVPVRSWRHVLVRMERREGRAAVTMRYDAVVGAVTAGSLVRDTRRRAGVSQVELGRRAGVTQSVVSAYESGRRQPSLPTLERLVRAAGLELDVAVRVAAPPRTPAPGPLGERLARSGARVAEIAGSYGLFNVRVFGSVARGEDDGDSDVDLLVDVGPGVGLMALARCQRDLEALLDASVDLVPARDLKEGVAASVLADVRPL